jgi:adenine deaminase
MRVESDHNKIRNPNSFDRKKMNKMMKLEEVISDNTPPYTVLINGTLFNALTREFFKGQSIRVKHGIIAYVAPPSDLSKSQETQSIDAGDGSHPWID